MTTKINNNYIRELQKQLQKEKKIEQELRIKKNKQSSMVNIELEVAKKFPSLYLIDEENKIVYLK